MPRMDYGVARIANTVYIGRVTTNNKGSTYVTGHAADIVSGVASFFDGPETFVRNPLLIGCLFENHRRERICTNGREITYMDYEQYRNLVRKHFKLPEEPSR